MGIVKKLKAKRLFRSSDCFIHENDVDVCFAWKKQFCTSGQPYIILRGCSWSLFYEQRKSLWLIKIWSICVKNDTNKEKLAKSKCAYLVLISRLRSLRRYSMSFQRSFRLFLTPKKFARQLGTNGIQVNSIWTFKWWVVSRYLLKAIVFQRCCFAF